MITLPRLESQSQDTDTETETQKEPANRAQKCPES